MNVAADFETYVLPTYARFPLVPVRGEGAYLWDDTGRKYLDFCTGIAVCSIGHCHPALTTAISQQAGTLMHVSNLFQIPQQAKLARTIVEDHVKIPGKVFFSNSGAEANDGMIKTARRFGHARPQADGTPRFEIITFSQSFHGRTLGSMAATAQAKIQEGFFPLLPGFRYAAFNDLDALAATITPTTAAIMLEPIQGEGGVNVATAEFLRGAVALAKQHDLLLMMDEVQAGFGRCGHAMAWRAIADEIEPDCISWAKGMGGGFPIGSFWVSDRAIAEQKPLSSLMGPGSHGSTYGGTPLACAASQAVLDVISSENLGAHAIAMEHYIRKIFTNWNQSIFQEIKGIGLLLGLAIRPDFVPQIDGKTPAQVIVAAFMEQGLLTVPAGPNVVRLLPPLTVTAAEIDAAFFAMSQAISAMA